MDEKRAADLLDARVALLERETGKLDQQASWADHMRAIKRVVRASASPQPTNPAQP